MHLKLQRRKNASDRKKDGILQRLKPKREKQHAKAQGQLQSEGKNILYTKVEKAGELTGALIRIHFIAHLKHMNFIACKLYVNN